MSSQQPAFELDLENADRAILQLSGTWDLDQQTPAFNQLLEELQQHQPRQIVCEAEQLAEWDSSLMAFLLQCHNYCASAGIELQTNALPEGARTLLGLSTAVGTHQRPAESGRSLWQTLNPVAKLNRVADNLEGSLGFLGELTLATLRLLRGKANIRRADFRNFLYQAGPDALPIITLTSFLMGMILAYLGAAQLAQFGAQIYVADLVTIGMLREMGALMTAVVMAGRTGAAYAAQLGTMQTREEIDAIVTLGISPMEFLVLPRFIALVLIMPLLCLYADLVGILGGGLVALGMGVSLTQFVNQAQEVLSFTHLNVGLFKSTVFGILIAIAGCRAGMNCGRSSAAVGQAATEAVVTSIVYIIIADAVFNIMFQQMGI
ncbi:MAG: MlaE family lipid ABC transporter permease subunit [Gammaproteobacteria bacterium]|nr:MlaE family lipid ABC transporter permease subunit [Gammaproteobacteria bacterium]